MAAIYHRLLTIGVFSFTIATANNGLAQDATTSTDGHCSSDHHDITEHPQGLINGINTAFTLSRKPQRDSCVLLFKTGLRLRTGIDFQVTGQDVTVSDSEVPKAGDSLTAIYTSSPKSAGKETSRDMPVSSFQLTMGGDVAESALREALVSELQNSVYPNSRRSNRGPSSAFAMIDDRQRRTPGDILRSTGPESGMDGLGDFAFASDSKSKNKGGGPSTRASKAKVPSLALGMLNDRAEEGLTDNHDNKPTNRIPAQ